MKKHRRFREIWHRFKRNRLAVIGLCLFVVIVAACLLAPVIAPYGESEMNTETRFFTPCAAHWFGTDNLGRDIFSRVLYGGRISLLLGLGSTVFSGLIGITLGAIAGFFGGKVDNAIMRVLDVFMALPTMMTAIAVSTVLGTGILYTMLAMGIATAPRFARIVRGPILVVRNSEYIEAARAIDLSTVKIIAKHVIPNVSAQIIVQATLYMASGLIAAASLSFVGLGVQPPSAEWGAMISAGRAYFRDHGHMILYPGISIMLTVFSLNVLGDGLRDALDPRLKN